MGQPEIIISQLMIIFMYVCANMSFYIVHFLIITNDYKTKLYVNLIDIRQRLVSVSWNLHVFSIKTNQNCVNVTLLYLPDRSQPLIHHIVLHYIQAIARSIPNFTNKKAPSIHQKTPKNPSLNKREPRLSLSHPP